MIKAVGLFLLLLLKIIGWALLIVLFLLVVALLLLLFVPLRYNVLAKNEQSMSQDQKGLKANVQLKLKVNWLLHFLQVSVLYGPDGLSNQILVAGIDIPKLLTRHAEKKKARRNSNKRKKGRRAVKKAEEPYVENNNSDNITLKECSSKEESLNKELLKEESPNKDFLKKEIQDEEIQGEIQQQVIQQEEIQQEEIQKEEIQQQVIQKEEIQQQIIQSKKEQEQKEQRSQKRQSPKDLHKHSGRKQKTDGHPKAERRHHTKTSDFTDSAADAHQPGIFKKIRIKLQRLHKEYTDEANRHAVGCLWIELLKLLRSYKPRKLKADVSFSLADPSLTGIATGLLSLMPVIYRYPCRIVPDFTSERLYAEGEISASGKVRIFVFLCSMLRLIRDKKFMQVVRRLMKRGSA